METKYKSSVVFHRPDGLGLPINFLDPAVSYTVTCARLDRWLAAGAEAGSVMGEVLHLFDEGSTWAAICGATPTVHSSVVHSAPAGRPITVCLKCRRAAETRPF